MSIDPKYLELLDICEEEDESEVSSKKSEMSQKEVDKLMRALANHKPMNSRDFSWKVIRPICEVYKHDPEQALSVASQIPKEKINLESLIGKGKKENSKLNSDELAIWKKIIEKVPLVEIVRCAHHLFHGDCDVFTSRFDWPIFKKLTNRIPKQLLPYCIQGTLEIIRYKIDRVITLEKIINLIQKEDMHSLLETDLIIAMLQKAGNYMERHNSGERNTAQGVVDKIMDNVLRYFDYDNLIKFNSLSKIRVKWTGDELFGGMDYKWKNRYRCKIVKTILKKFWEKVSYEFLIEELRYYSSYVNDEETVQYDLKMQKVIKEALLDLPKDKLPKVKNNKDFEKVASDFWHFDKNIKKIKEVFLKKHYPKMFAKEYDQKAKNILDMFK